MKKLDRLILRSFLGPLLLTFVIAVFVLLMQFVWKYIDDMVGKGLPFNVLAELLFYAASTFVPMALPIAVLFASIMTMGSFGEKYELVAMKAGGISVRRIMMPLAMVALLLTGVAFYFANNVLPVAMLKYKMTLFDVTRKKPALNIKASEYYTDIEGYVIRANEKDPDNGMLRDIIIYDHTHRIDQSTVVTADSAIMQTSPDERYLILTLYDGHDYNEATDGNNYYARPFTRIGFHQQVMTFDLSSFAFDETNGDFFKGNYQMMNISQLKDNVARLEKNRDKHYADLQASMADRLKTATMAMPMAAQKETATPLQTDTLADAQDDSTLTGTLQGKEERQLESAANSETPYAEILNGEAPTLLPGHHTPGNLRATQRHGIATDKPNYKAIPVFSRQALAALSPKDRQRVVSKARENMSASQNELRMYEDLLHSDDEFINRHYIEWQRKFTLSLACLVLFLVGAPFGSIVRKGGLGLPLVASVFFFVMYYVVGMIAEKSVRESAMGPEGMWVSTLVMLPIGIVLTLVATSDGSLFARRSSRQKHAIRLPKPPRQT